jgi:small basic protein (TIGR04137 family)
MSIHASLKISGKLSGERNVWTRAERIAALQKLGRWNDGDDVVGLPKVRTRFKVKSKKQLKAEATQPVETKEGGGDAAKPAKTTS